jgi:hypothetical protein
MRSRLATIVALLGAAAVAAGALAGGVHAQGGNGISSPTPGQVVRGSVQIVGTATLPDFLRYELYFSADEQVWVYFTGGPAPVIGGVLGYWDTLAAGLPDGRYTLRMRVVRADSNYDEYFVRGLTVANAAPPTVEATATPLEQPDTPTPRATGENLPGGTITVTVELPPTRRPATATPAARPNQRATPGALIDLPSLNLEGAGAALIAGVSGTVALFAVIGGYTAARGGLRWLARRARRTLYRRRHRGSR